jgi:hypothetical protein
MRKKRGANRHNNRFIPNSLAVIPEDKPPAKSPRDVDSRNEPRHNVGALMNVLSSLTDDDWASMIESNDDVLEKNSENNMHVAKRALDTTNHKKNTPHADKNSNTLYWQAEEDEDEKDLTEEEKTKLIADINNHGQSERQRKCRGTGKLVTGGVLATGISFAVIHKTAIIGLCLAHPVAALAVAALALTALIVSAMMLCRKNCPDKKASQKHNEKNISKTKPFTDPSKDLPHNSSCWPCC